MTIREATFGDLFKIAFWVHLGPTLLAMLVAGLFVSAVFLITPGLPAAMVELGVPGVPPAFGEFGTAGAIAAVWAVTLIYAAALTGFAALRTLSGAIVLVWWRRWFMKPAQADSAPPAISLQPAE